MSGPLWNRPTSLKAHVAASAVYMHAMQSLLFTQLTKLPYLQYVAPLPWEIQKSKNVTNFDSFLDKLLTCSWRHSEHLIQHLTVFRLLTLSDWPTFWSLSDKSTAEPYSAEHCCIMAILSPWLSSHNLHSFYTILRMLYTYLCDISVADYARSHIKF